MQLVPLVYNERLQEEVYLVESQDRGRLLSRLPLWTPAVPMGEQTWTRDAPSRMPSRTPSPVLRRYDEQLQERVFSREDIRDPPAHSRLDVKARSGVGTVVAGPKMQIPTLPVPWPSYVPDDSPPTSPTSVRTDDELFPTSSSASTSAEAPQIVPQGSCWPVLWTSSPVWGDNVEFGSEQPEEACYRWQPWQTDQEEFDQTPEQALEAHLRGECRPCAYYVYKDDGCRWGESCKFCHLDPPGEISRRKKEKRKLRKAALAAQMRARIAAGHLGGKV
eukprot:CAMPEP_0171058076 /NCGR_PEP_ID=MMETSP0766_2-20121228/2247_1 /TAXON_ID=439317 /ORGANISM="Gambierdiscus australes, Strain CAWD 149" /LENGTH=275 /DNA_ID=CAMNT_0011513295 /DNA_START=182 /DNA_END=1008 /DNA_ORIENTATION=+